MSYKNKTQGHFFSHRPDVIYGIFSFIKSKIQQALVEKEDIKLP